MLADAFVDDGQYSAVVVDHFEHPRHAGPPDPGPDHIEAVATDQAQEVHFRLSARVEQGHLSMLRFQAYGCPHSLAAASWLCERMEGADLPALDAWDWRDAAAALSVPVTKYGRLLVLEDAVRALAMAWRSQQAAAENPAGCRSTESIGRGRSGQGRSTRGRLAR